MKLEDVAAKAQVSITTVSRVLNDTGQATPSSLSMVQKNGSVQTAENSPQEWYKQTGPITPI